MTILELIQAQCRTSGVPEKYAEKIQKLFNIEKEEGIGNYVQMYKDNILSDIQTADQAYQTATQTAVTEYEKKHNLKDGKPVEKTKEAKVDTSTLSPELKAMFDAQTAQIAALTDIVKGVTTTVTTTQKKGTAKELFKDAKLPEKWLSRIDVDSEITVEEQIKTLQSEYAELKQSIIDGEVEAGDYKPYTGAPKDRTEADWVNLMDRNGTVTKDSSVASLGLDN